MIDFILTIIWGLLAHQTSSFTEQIQAKNPQDLANYSIGYLGCIPASGWWFWRLRETQNVYVRFVVALCMGGLGFGIGVALGRILDSQFGIERGKKP